MRTLITLTAVLSMAISNAQIDARTSSYKFASGTYPTVSVDLEGSDARDVADWFKNTLGSMSTSVEMKKEITATGVTLASISPEPFTIYAKADQPRKSTSTTLHVAFIVNGEAVLVGSGNAQAQACKDFVAEKCTQYERQRLEKSLAEEEKDLASLEGDLDGLKKDQEKLEDNLSKTRQKNTEALQEIEKLKNDLKNIEFEIEAKRQAVASAPTEENTKDLQNVLKDQRKLQEKRDKETRISSSAQDKITDLEAKLISNGQQQEDKAKEIEKQKGVVNDVRTSLGKL